MNSLRRHIMMQQGGGGRVDVLPNQIIYRAAAKIADGTYVPNNTLVSHVFDGDTGIITYQNDITSINQIRGYLGITEIYLPDYIEQIPSYFAYNMSSLTYVQFPLYATIINVWAFAGTQLSGLHKLPIALKKIDRYGFRGSGNREMIIDEFPATLTTLVDNLFGEMYKITQIKILNTDSVINGNGAIRSNVTILVPNILLPAYQESGSGWTNYNLIGY